MAGARHSQSDLKDMQALHDIAVRQGAACAPAKAVQIDPTAHPGAMIALMLAPDAQQALRDIAQLPDAEADHLTLAYLADDAAAIESLKNAILTALGSMAMFTPSIEGEIGGVARFSATDGQDALVALYDSPALADVQHTVCEAMEYAGVVLPDDHGFTPHITLTYLNPDAPLPIETLPRLPITFHAISLVWAGERIDLPLSTSAKAGAPLTGNSAHAPCATIKALPNRTIAVKVAYGGPHGGKDGHGEFFSPNTDFDPENFPAPPLLYYHGYDEHGRKMRKPVITGRMVSRGNVADGHELIYQLKPGRYADLQWEAALKGACVVSPGTVGHLIRKSPDGELLYWPLAEISAWDYAENRKQANAYSVAAPILKALYADAGLPIPAALTTPETAGDAVSALHAIHSIKTTQEYAMTPEEIQALVAAEAAKALQAQQASAAAAAEAARAEQARVDAAVAAERIKWDAEAAKTRRLPDVQGAPYVTSFHDTRKYDGMSVNDLAFTAEMLGAAYKSRRSNQGVSRSALKALAIKIAEDKSALGEEARRDLKAAGIAPEDVTNSAKANELDYSTQAGYGDEWVGVEYSRRMWPAIRANTFVLNKLPSIEVPQGMESVAIPLEGADPTWYLVAQTTGTNSTTGIPDATVASSKLGTDSKTLSVKKVGARTIYTGELEEDSLIPWAAQLRQQLEVSGGEQIEHLIIDGDTATGATTNINCIGGTPAGTELYLAFNGFRKSPLVTTTANSRSAAGSFADTDFLNTLALMGAAGLNASDPTKTEFIIDANVMWKAMQILSVKTRDVFLEATLENGMFNSIYGRKVYTSYFMHFASTTNPRKANTSGKVDTTTQSNNTTGSILAVRWDQWLFGYKRRITIELDRMPASDSTQIIALARIGLTQRDTEASALTYNVGV